MRKQQGLTLIDVMVAIVLLSIGILGMVALQASSTQNSVNSESRATAALLADEMVAAFQGSVTNAAASNPAIPSGTTLSNWQAKVAALLPGGDAAAPVAGAVANSMVVTITWIPTSGPGQSVTNAGKEVYTTTAYWP